MEKPERIELTQAEADALIDRVKHKQLADSDYALLVGIVRFMFWLQHRLSESKISLRRLKAFFGFAPKSEKKDLKK